MPSDGSDGTPLFSPGINADGSTLQDPRAYLPPPITPSSMPQPPMTALEFAKLLRKSNNLPTDGSVAYSPGQASTAGSILSSGPACAPLPSLPDQGNTKTPLTLSPRLQSLPDNAINPLGLLAEASLQNSHRKKSFTGGHAGAMLGMMDASRGTSVSGVGAQQESGGSAAGDRTASSMGPGAAGEQGGSALDEEAEDGAGGKDMAEGEVPRFGVSHEGYFKPGGMTIVPLRAVLLEREVSLQALDDAQADPVPSSNPRS